MPHNTEHIYSNHLDNQLDKKPSEINLNSSVKKKL